MHGPEPVAWLLTTVCALAALVCLARARSGPRPLRRMAAAESVMAFGMAAMALPAQPVPPLGYVALFTATAAGSAVLLCRGAPHQAHHLVESLTMVYMGLAMTGPATGPHTAHQEAGGVPAVTGVLLLYFGLYALRAGLRLLPAAEPLRPGPLGGTELGVACRLSLAIGMAAMLLTL